MPPTSNGGIEISLSTREDGTLLAVYVRLSRGKTARTREIGPGTLLVDVDARGRPVGIEILAPIRLSKITKLVGTPKRRLLRDVLSERAPEFLRA